MLQHLYSFIKNYRRQVFIASITLVLYFMYMHKSKPSWNGDAIEYIYTTEAFSNHCTPFITSDDIYQSDLILKKKEPREDYIPSHIWGFVLSKQKKYVAMHFWGYSLICTPFKAIFEIFGINPYLCFKATNILLFICVAFYLLFYSSIKEFLAYLLIIIFFFSGTLYYIPWTHPEIYTSVLFFLSLISIYDKRLNLSVLFASLASFQNPPIIFVLPFVGIYHIIIYGFDFRKIIQLVLVGSISLFPFVFNFIHFGSMSSVSDFIDYNKVGLSRLHSTFLDINQGVIVNIPVIFIVTFFFLGKNIYKKRLSFLDLLPVIAIIISIPTMPQANWNMGQSVISRYAYWISVPLLLYSIIQLSRLKRNFYYLIPITIFQIIWSVSIKRGDWHYVNHKQLAYYILQNHPSLYNPEPEIFAERTLHREAVGPSFSPVLFSTKSTGITKIMVHQSKVDELRLDTLINNHDSKYIQNQLNNLSFERGWAYINVK